MVSIGSKDYKKRLIPGIFLVLIIVSFLSYPLFFNHVSIFKQKNFLFEPKTSYIVSNPIFIIGNASGVGVHNWTWGSNQPWCTGLGTENDPFIIGNLIINNNATNFSIKIINSSKYFIIRNSTFLGSNQFENGIILEKVVNGSIINNIFQNNYNGLSLIDSLNITVRNNLFLENLLGLNISGTNSVNNLFYNNSFEQNGIHAIDNGLNSFFNNSLIGNYWDNYSGMDESPRDGIGDISYLIQGGAGSIDFLPIWKTNVNIQLISPNESFVYELRDHKIKILVDSNENITKVQWDISLNSSSYNWKDLSYNSTSLHYEGTFNPKNFEHNTYSLFVNVSYLFGSYIDFFELNIYPFLDYNLSYVDISYTSSFISISDITALTTKIMASSTLVHNDTIKDRFFQVNIPLEYQDGYNYHIIRGNQTFFPYESTISYAIFNTSSYQAVDVLFFEIDGAEMSVSNILNLGSDKFEVSANVTSSRYFNNLTFVFEFNFNAKDFEASYWEEPEKWYLDGEWIQISPDECEVEYINSSTILRVNWNSINASQTIQLKVLGTRIVSGDNTLIIILSVVGVAVVAGGGGGVYIWKRKRSKKSKTKQVSFTVEDISFDDSFNQMNWDKNFVFFKDNIPINADELPDDFKDEL